MLPRLIEKLQGCSRLDPSAHSTRSMGFVPLPILQPIDLSIGWVER